MSDQSDLTGHVAVDMKEMADVLRRTAHDHESRQKALVAAGVISAIDPRERRLILVLDKAAEMIERIEPYIDDLRKVIRSRRFQMRNGS